MNDKSLYTISEMIDLTGATEFLLRSWELRYKVVRPKRTKTGRRLYSNDDVLKISKIVSLTAQGHKIGQLSKLSLEDLSALEVSCHEVGRLGFDSEKHSTPVQQVYESLATTDWEGLEAVFNTQRKKLPGASYIYDFILPITKEMSRRSSAQSIDIIQEHLLTSLIKENLYTLRGKGGRRRNRSRIIFATPEGDHHDLGLLVAKVLADLSGHECVYLGSHVPKKELAEACVRLMPTHIVLSTNAGAGRTVDNFLKYISFVDKHVPSNINLWLGGASVQGVTLKLDRPFLLFDSIEMYAEKLGGPYKKKSK